MDLIGIVVFMLVVCLFYWGFNTLAASFGIPAQIVTVIHVVFVIVVVLYLLQLLGLWSGGPSLRLG